MNTTKSDSVINYVMQCIGARGGTRPYYKASLIRLSLQSYAVGGSPASVDMGNSLALWASGHFGRYVKRGGLPV